MQNLHYQPAIQVPQDCEHFHDLHALPDKLQVYQAVTLDNDRSAYMPYKL
jgi:hypothetical protein